MAKKQWKDFETQVACKVGGKRQGGAPGHAWPDVISAQLVIECKYRKLLPKWLKKALRQAKVAAHTWGNKGKFPAVAIKEKGMHGFIVLMHSDDWAQWFGEVTLKEEEV